MHMARRHRCRSARCAFHYVLIVLMLVLAHFGATSALISSEKKATGAQSPKHPAAAKSMVGEYSLGQLLARLRGGRHRADATAVADTNVLQLSASPCPKQVVLRRTPGPALTSAPPQDETLGSQWMMGHPKMGIVRGGAGGVGGVDVGGRMRSYKDVVKDEKADATCIKLSLSESSAAVWPRRADSWVHDASSVPDATDAKSKASPAQVKPVMQQVKPLREESWMHDSEVPDTTHTQTHTHTHTHRLSKAAASSVLMSLPPLLFR